MLKISPWLWIALAIALAAVEMLTPTTVLIWSAGAALATGILLWIIPIGLAVQIAVFGGLSIALTLAGRALFQNRLAAREEPTTLNRRADQVVGREAVVMRFDHGDGQVQVDGVPWPARLEAGGAEPMAGDRVLVTGADGIVVRVRTI